MIDRARRKVKDEEDELPLCRACGVPLMTNAEALLGVHIRCVANSKKRRLQLPTPGYRYRKR